MGKNKDEINKRTSELVAQAVLGNHEAISALYCLYKNRLESAVRARLGMKLRSRMETADLIQSVWKDMLTDIKDFEYRGADSFYRWLLTRIVRKIKDKGKYFSTEKRNLEKERDFQGDESVLEGMISLSNSELSSGQATIAKEERALLKRVLARLSSAQRQAVVLRMKEEMDFESIGGTMGKSAEAARKLYARGVKRLGELIQEHHRRNSII